MGLIVADGASCPIDTANPTTPGVSANFLGVDSDANLRITPRISAIGRLSSYRVAATSSNITATLSANAAVWGMTMTVASQQPGSVSANSNAFKIAIVKSIWAGAVVTGTITTAVPFDLALYFGRNSAANRISGGTNIQPTPPPQQAARSTQGQLPMANVWISSGGALTTVIGVEDTNALTRVQGYTGTVVGTQFFSGAGSSGMVPLYVRDGTDNHPIVLGSNWTSGIDSLVIQNPLLGPATGTFTLTVVVEWMEAFSF